MLVVEGVSLYSRWANSTITPAQFLSVIGIEAMLRETNFFPAKAGVDTFQGPLGHPGIAMESSRLEPNGRTCLLRFELDERVIFTKCY